MYCVKCGVRLADTEKKCPLCGTVVYHPEIKRKPAEPLYPGNKLPKESSDSTALSGAIVFLFLIPLVICFFADFLIDGEINWFGYVGGALVITYIAFALPLWFKKPNPVIFVPCNFAATALYLLYINHATGGGWFLSFAFPIAGGLCIIICVVVSLLYYLRRGKLYIFGGAFIALGALMLMAEFLMGVTFGFKFIGWSVYPLVVLALLGGFLIYLAANVRMREILERKLFF